MNHNHCNTKPLNPKKVLIGMSGGVDSTVAAYLLKEQGYEVVGAKLVLWKDSPAHDSDAERICNKLGIEYLEIDRQEEFRNEIVRYFIETYEKGETPNPCVRCNRRIKFASLLEIADQIGAYYVATGHYADVRRNETTGRYELHRSPSMKDQTYALAQLTQDQLARIRMPLSGLRSKDETRRIAATIDADISSKSDSQEICFIPNDDYLDFLKRHGHGSVPGEIVYEGASVASHPGIESFTIGQRKGLGITFGKPVYVVDIDADNRRVTLGSNEDLMSKQLLAEQANFIAIADIPASGSIECFAKIRYSATPAKCRLRNATPDMAEAPAASSTGTPRLLVEFDTPQRAVTPGQVIVFYTTPDLACTLQPEDAPRATSVLGSAIIANRNAQRELRSRQRVAERESADQHNRNAQRELRSR